MKKMGNLAFTDSHNQLTISNIHKMSTCRLFEKFIATSRQCLGQPLNKAKRPVRKSGSKGHVQQQEAPARTRPSHYRGPLPLVPRSASPHRGNLVAVNIWSSAGHATSKSLSNKELTIFRVGIFTTLKMVKQLSHSDLQVAPNVSA